MEYRIELFSGKKLVGKRIKMTLSNNKTAKLWQSFMLRRKEIKNNGPDSEEEVWIPIKLKN